MTIQNFLKTAILGIALCPIVGISNGITSPGVSLQGIFDKLLPTNNYTQMNLSLKQQNKQIFQPDVNNNSLPLSEDLEEKVMGHLLSIKNTIGKALENNVISDDVSTLIDDINYFEMENIPYCEYTEDINLILQHKDIIIGEVENHMQANE